MEVLQLLDRLEGLVTEATRVPLTSRSLVDEQEFVELIDEIRANLPEEVRHAKKLSQDKEKVLNQAQVEADRILATATDRARQLIEENELVRAAREEAEAIYNKALAEAEDVRRGADNYALTALDELEQHLTRLLATVRKGKTLLERSIHQPSANDGGIDGDSALDTARAR